MVRRNEACLLDRLRLQKHASSHSEALIAHTMHLPLSTAATASSSVLEAGLSGIARACKDAGGNMTTPYPQNTLHDTQQTVEGNATGCTGKMETITTSAYGANPSPNTIAAASIAGTTHSSRSASVSKSFASALNCSNHHDLITMSHINRPLGDSAPAS